MEELSMNTENVARGVKLPQPLSLSERIASHQAICLHTGLGPDRAIPGFNTGEEAAQTLFEFGNEFSAPTLVIADANEVIAAWVFETPVPPTQLEQLAEALGNAATTYGLEFDADCCERTKLVTVGDVITVDKITDALREWLPER
jgi:hypothetical protein